MGFNKVRRILTRALIPAVMITVFSVGLGITIYITDSMQREIDSLKTKNKTASQQVTDLNKQLSSLEGQYDIIKQQNNKLTELLEAENKLVQKHLEQQSKASSESTSRGGPSRRPLQTLRMKGTAYTLSVYSCGKSRSHPQYGMTASGTRATQYRTVAVDPRVIPLGSILYIEFPEKFKYLNGYYLAEDTGSAVKGNILDVFIGEDEPGKDYYEDLADVFGRQSIRVYLLERGTGKVDKRHVASSGSGAARFTPYRESKDNADNAKNELKENSRIYRELCSLRGQES